MISAIHSSCCECLLRRFICVLYALVAAFGVDRAAVAQSPVEFFKGRIVNLLIGSGVGGDEDLWGRTIAKYIGSHIPGRPIIIPQNMTGAGGLVLLNRLYNVAPRDGSVIGMINRGIPFEPLLGGQGAQFDATKLTWIGSPNHDTTVCAARVDAPVRRMQDLFSLALKVGATGSGADTATYPEVLKAIVGMKFNVVRGYQGSHEIQLAIERNEVQGICLAFDSLRRGTLFQSRELNLLLEAGAVRDPRLIDVPFGIDSARSEEERKALELFFVRALLGRPLVAPPQLPADRAAILRKAFDETMRDPAFLADAEAEKLRVDGTSGERLSEIVVNAYRTPPSIVKRTMQAMGRSN